MQRIWPHQTCILSYIWDQCKISTYKVHHRSDVDFQMHWSLFTLQSIFVILAIFGISITRHFTFPSSDIYNTYCTDASFETSPQYNTLYLIIILGHNSIISDLSNRATAREGDVTTWLVFHLQRHQICKMMIKLLSLPLLNNVVDGFLVVQVRVSANDIQVGCQL